MDDTPQASLQTPFFALGQPANATTTDKGITNQLLNSISSSLASSSTDVVAALNAIATAINTKATL